MRKLFLLIPALVLALAVNAEYRYPDAATENSLRSAVSAAAAGDVIVLNGTYGNTTSDYILINKNLTIQVADGKTATIKPIAPLQVASGASVKFIGIKFDGSSIDGYSYFIRFNDTSSNNCIEFEDCEFTATAKQFFLVKDDCKGKLLRLKSCKIYSNTNQIVANSGTLDAIEMEGCEIYNNSTHIIYNPSGKTISACTIKKCDIHNNAGVIVNNEGTLTELTINTSKMYNCTGSAVIKNVSNMETMAIDSTEFYGNSNYNINGTSASHMDACTINHSYFHNNTKSAVIFAKSATEGVETIDQFTLKNSTIANNDSLTGFDSQVYLRAYNDASTNTIKVIVDHCTCYNNPTLNYDHSNFRFYNIKDVTISNCIFAHRWPGVDIPEGKQDARYAALAGGGTAAVKNCISYNYLKNASGFSGLTATDCSTSNPLFADPNNGDFTFPGNYITGNISPARGAATDKSDLGDPRWYTDAVYPTTDFSGMGYDFEAVDASLSGNILLETEGPNDPYLRYYHEWKPGTAEWLIKVTRACYVTATVNMADNEWKSAEYFQNHKHVFIVELRDANNNLLDSVQEGDHQADGGSDGWDTYPTVNLIGSIYIPEAGIYTIKLKNNRNESRCGVGSVTLKYTGGLTIAIPDTLKPIDALLSSKAFVDQTGAVDSLKFSTTNSDVPNQWAKWKISVPKNGTYRFAAHVASSNRHNYRLTIKSADESSTIATFYGPADNSGERVITFDDVNLSGSTNYVVMIQDTVKWSYGRVLNVFASRPISLSDQEENASATTATIAEFNDGFRVDAQLDRNFVGGMYNTVCLPFAVSEAELNRIFPGAQVKELTSSSIEEGDFVLNLNFTAVSAMEAGKPYIIKPAADVSAPKFVNVIISVEDPINTETQNADFIGNFVASTILASEDNLFLGADNTLYFAAQNIDIDGLRGYFHIHGSGGGPAPTIRRARIVERENIVTEVELVGDDNNQPTNVQKVLQNGQIFILRDGIRYNALGIRVQ